MTEGRNTRMKDWRTNKNGTQAAHDILRVEEIRSAALTTLKEQVSQLSSYLRLIAPYYETGIERGVYPVGQTILSKTIYLYPGKGEWLSYRE